MTVSVRILFFRIFALKHEKKMIELDFIIFLNVIFKKIFTCPFGTAQSRKRPHGSLSYPTNMRGIVNIAYNRA